MSNPNQIIYFDWLETTPDPRPFKPGMPKLQPVDIQVAVSVPINEEYFHNAENLLINQVSTNPTLIQPVLTPKGLKYVIDQLETAMKEEEISEISVNDWHEDDVISSSKDDFIEFRFD